MAVILRDGNGKLIGKAPGQESLPVTIYGADGGNEPPTFQLSGSNAQLGAKITNYSFNPPLGIGQVAEICNVQEPCVVEFLQWAGNRVQANQLRILRIENGVEFSLGELRPTGFVHGFVPNQIVQNFPGMWEVLQYDADSTPHAFKFQLRQPIVCPEGVKVTLTSTDSVARDIGVRVWVRTY